MSYIKRKGMHFAIFVTHDWSDLWRNGNKSSQVRWPFDVDFKVSFMFQIKELLKVAKYENAIILEA